jgi:hypothetical protein
MPQCLFCLRDTRVDAIRFTDEHVFPAALGGNLVVRDGSCDACNHGISKFEQALAAELKPIRMLLRIPNRYGNVPNSPVTIITPANTYSGRVESDGNVVVTPLVMEEQNEKGEHEVVYRFLSDEGKETLRARAKRRGEQLIETGPGEPVEAEVHINGDLKVIGEEAGLRSVAKIAYVGLVYQAGIRIVAGDAFSEVRKFILEGKPEGVTRIFTNKRYLQACQQGPHQHSIAVAARRDRHRVDAIVRLFGELTYFVVLSDRYDGPDFCNTLVYDANRGEVNGILFAHEQAELLQTDDILNSEETVWEDLETFGRNFCEFFDRAIQKYLEGSSANETKTS